MNMIKIDSSKSSLSLMRNLTLGTIFTILLAVTLNADAEELRVVSIRPSGNDISATKQIAVTFNQPITSFPYDAARNLASHIEITPKIECEWLFLNKKTIACNTTKELQPATTYSIIIYPSLQSLSGHSLPAPYRSSFVTTRPKIIYSNIQKWLSPGKPAVFISANQQILGSSVEKNFYFQDQKGNKYPISILDSNYKSKKKGIFSFASAMQKNNHANYSTEYRADWVIYPRSELPHNQEFILIADIGLQSIHGSQTSTKSQELMKVNTYGEFAILDAKCIAINNKLVSIIDTTAPIKCNPSMPIMVTFNNPVNLRSLIATTVVSGKITPKITVYPVNSTKGNTYYEAAIYGDWSPTTDYSVTINQDYRSVIKRIISKIMRVFNKYYDNQYSLHDEFNQSLQQSLKMRFSTGNASPDFQLQDKYAVLEKNHDGGLTVYTTNIQSITFDYSLILPDLHRQTNIINLQIKDNNRNKAILSVFNENAIFGKVAGLAYGSLSSFPRVNRGNNASTVLIESTSLNVNATVSAEDINVVVYDKTTTETIDNANVSLMTWEWEKGKPWNIKNSQTTKNGVATIKHDGVAMEQDRYFIMVRSAKDIAILPLINKFSRKQSGVGYGNNLMSWGTTDRFVYKPGESVKYKIYVRDKFSYGDKPNTRYKIRLVDPKGYDIYSLGGISLSQFGAMDGVITLPNKITRGKYDVLVEPENQSGVSLKAASIFIDVYTSLYSEIKSTISNTTPITPYSELMVSTYGWLLGNKMPMSGASTLLNVQIKPDQYRPQNSAVANFIFGNGDGDSVELGNFEVILDKNGLSQFVKDMSVTQNAGINHGLLTVTAIARDTSGKYISSKDDREFFLFDKMVGLKLDDGIFSLKDNVVISSAVVDNSGQMVGGIPIYITVECEDKDGWWKKAKAIKLTSNTHSASSESIVFTNAGRYRVTAEISNGNKSQAYFYVSKNVNEHPPILLNTDSNLTSDKRKYNVGDQAYYIVNNPYDESNAIFSIVQNKTIKSFVQKLGHGANIVSLPVTDDLAPGFSLTVELINSKADNYFECLTTAVTNPQSDIALRIETDKIGYANGDKVNAIIQSDYDKSIEVTLIIINTGSDVSNYLHSYIDYKRNTQSPAIHLDNYGLFASRGENKVNKSIINDYSQSSVGNRDVEILYWQPSVVLAPHEKIEISFSAPNKTGQWSIIAIATDDDVAITHKDVVFSSKGAVEVAASIPQHIVSGDQIQARFVLYNSSNESHDFSIELALSDNDETRYYKRSMAPGSYTDIRYENVLHNNTEARLTIRDSNNKQYHSSTYPILVTPKTQQQNDTIYGIVSTDMDEKLNYNADPPTVVLMAFRPFYHSVNNILSRHSTEESESWDSKLTKAIRLSAEAISNYQMRLATSEISLEAQNIILSAHQYFITDSETADLIDNDDKIWLAAKTLIQFQNFKSSGYIVPIAVEKQIIATLDNYYNRNIKNLPRQLDLLALVAYAIGNVDVSPMTKYVDVMQPETLLHYLSASKDSGETVIAFNDLLNGAFSTPGSLALFSGQNNFVSNCTAVTGLRNTLNKDDIINLVRYTLNSVPDNLSNNDVMCLGEILAYSYREERDTGKHLALNIDSNSLKSESLYNDLAIVDTAQQHSSLCSIKKLSGRGSTPYLLQTISDVTLDYLKHNGIQIKKKYEILRDNRLQTAELPLDIKVGEILMTEIILNASIPLRDIYITESIPGGLEIIESISQQQADTNLSTEDYDIDNAGNMTIKIKEIKAGEEQRIRYLSYGKSAGTFTSLATIAKVADSDISGHNALSTIKIKTPD